MKKLLPICLVMVLALAALACGGPASKPAAPKVKDPVCGMEIDPAQAVKLDREGKSYRFCSEYCKKQFEKDPAKFTGLSGTAPPRPAAR